LLVFLLRLKVLEENYLEETGLEENIDESWSHLDNSNIEEEGRAKQWQDDIVVNRSKRIVLFVG
jgi:hypothetical protein